MFRALAEAFQDAGAASGQYPYYKNQTTYYQTTLPNAALVGTIPAAKDFRLATGTASPIASAFQTPSGIAPYGALLADALISPQVSQEFAAMQQQCQAASIDDLLASQNPKSQVRCGWLYSPPTSSLNPIPQLSKGALGTADGPVYPADPSAPQQRWFWDLAQAKQQVLQDRCRALRNCQDTNSASYASCGYCPETGQGIPVDSTGAPLYPTNPRLSCPVQPVTDPTQCPPPVVPSPAAGPTQPSANPCAPQNSPGDGRLSATCLASLVREAGCSDSGALAVALTTGATPGDYMAGAKQLKSLQVYNQRSKVPFPISPFSQGNTTVALALSAVQQVASQTGPSSAPPATGLAAAARDLCLQAGAINSFNFCQELADTTPPPYDLSCLQNLFTSMGGQPSGQLYPTTQNQASYWNMKPSWGTVRAAIQQLLQNTKSSDAYIQGQAMQALYGINTVPGWESYPQAAGPLQQFDTAATEMMVGTDEVGNVYRLLPGQNASGWQRLPPVTTSGRGASAASIGTDGTVWALDAATSAPYQWHDSDGSWFPISFPSDAPKPLSVSVLSANNVWVLFADGSTAVWDGASLATQSSPSSGAPTIKQLSVGKDGDAWGVDSRSGALYRWTNGWRPLNIGQMSIIAVGDQYNVWALDSGGAAYSLNVAADSLYGGWKVTFGGYGDQCEPSTNCFKNTSLQTAQKQCCDDWQCQGFSYTYANGGSGCYLSDMSCKYTTDPIAMGFGKVDLQPCTMPTPDQGWKRQASSPSGSPIARLSVGPGGQRVTALTRANELLSWNGNTWDLIVLQ